MNIFEKLWYKWEGFHSGERNMRGVFWGKFVKMYYYKDRLLQNLGLRGCNVHKKEKDHGQKCPTQFLWSVM